MSQAEVDERALQLTQAMDRASQAGKTDDVAKLQERLGDEGPYELLCVVRALLKKIKQRVLVGDAVDVLGIDWVDQRAMVETVHARRSELVDPPVANVDNALLVFALERPRWKPSSYQVPREHGGHGGSVHAGAQQVRPVLGGAKGGLGGATQQWGYVPRFVSVATGGRGGRARAGAGDGDENLPGSTTREDEGEGEGEEEEEEEEDGFGSLSGPDVPGRSPCSRVRPGWVSRR